MLGYSLTVLMTLSEFAQSSVIAQFDCRRRFQAESQMSVFSPTQCERQKRFQERADEADVVICVLSKEFADSKTTREQVSTSNSVLRLSVIILDFFMNWLSRQGV